MSILWKFNFLSLKLSSNLFAKHRLLFSNEVSRNVCYLKWFNQSLGLSLGWDDHPKLGCWIGFGIDLPCTRATALIPRFSTVEIVFQWVRSRCTSVIHFANIFTTTNLYEIFLNRPKTGQKIKSHWKNLDCFKFLT